MANISVTYTFSNGSTADATEINTNYQDVIDGTSDGTKDFSIAALTCAGTLTANGNVNLGNATSDDITVTGRIAADLDPKTASATDLGDSTQLWRAAYVDNFLGSINAVGDPTYSFHADTDTGIYSTGANTLDFATGGTRALYIDSSQVVRPVTAIDMDGAKIRTLATEDVSVDASGADISWSTNNYDILDADTYVNFYCTTGSTNRTITLPTAADNEGRIITVKKVDSGSGKLTLQDDPVDSALIDGAASWDLYSQYEAMTVQSDGATWHTRQSRLLNEGSWAPTFSSTVGTSAGPTAAYNFRFSRVGNLVTIVGCAQFTKNAATVDTLFDLPTEVEPTSNFAANNVAQGAASTVDDSQFISGLVFTSSGTKKIRLLVKYTGTTSQVQNMGFTMAYPIA